MPEAMRKKRENETRNQRAEKGVGMKISHQFQTKTCRKAAEPGNDRIEEGSLKKESKAECNEKIAEENDPGIIMPYIGSRAF